MPKDAIPARLLRGARSPWAVGAAAALGALGAGASWRLGPAAGAAACAGIGWLAWWWAARSAGREASALLARADRADHRFLGLLEATPHAKIVADQHGSIVFVSERASELLGRSTACLVGTSVWAAIDGLEPTAPPGGWTSSCGRWSALVARGDRLRAVRPDGRSTPVEVRLGSLDDAGETLIILSLTDVTKRVAAEEAADRYNAELERRNQEMERFIYTVSHDLKSPLVTFLGFLGHLRRDAAAGRVDRVASFVDRLEVAAAAMRQKIDDLLNLSRIGRVVALAAGVPLDDVAAKAVEGLRAEAAAARAAVTVRTGLPVVMADRERLEDAMTNLVANAIKYGCDGQRREVEVGAEEVEGGYVRAWVRDHGKGIPAEQQSKVFGLFQRLDTTKEGTGVGLAIVKRVIEVQGGHVGVESAPGEGSTFWFTLPGAPAAPAAPAARDEGLAAAAA